MKYYILEDEKENAEITEYMKTVHEDAFKYKIINRPGVAGAVLQTPLSLIY